MSPTRAKVSTIMPPPPTPCSTRAPISSGRFRARPQATEAIRKIEVEARYSRLRPNMSPSLPHSGVTAVDASRYAALTHAMSSNPFRSSAIRGNAVETIVWSRAAKRTARISALMAAATPPALGDADCCAFDIGTCLSGSGAQGRCADRHQSIGLMGLTLLVLYVTPL